jgi:hypothetical protein
VLVLGVASVVQGEVFYAKDEAFRLAFPTATAVAQTTKFLTEAQVAAAKERAGVEVSSRLFTFYTARRESEILGYAVIDTHVVRTLPETVLVVLTPAGAVDQVLMLAFYEPREYLPPPHWLEQFAGRDLDGRRWRLGGDLHGISGATLTARGITHGVRKALVLFDLLVRPGKINAAPDGGRSPDGSHSPDGGHSPDGSHSPDAGRSPNSGPSPAGGRSPERAPA